MLTRQFHSFQGRYAAPSRRNFPFLTQTDNFNQSLDDTRGLRKYDFNHLFSLMA